MRGLTEEEREYLRYMLALTAPDWNPQAFCPGMRKRLWDRGLLHLYEIDGEPGLAVRTSLALEVLKYDRLARS